MNIFVKIIWLVVLFVLTTAQDQMRNHRIRQLGFYGNSRLGEESGSKITPSIILNLIVVPVVHDKEEERQRPLKHNWQWPWNDRAPGPAEGVLPTNGCENNQIWDRSLGTCIRRPSGSGTTTRRPVRSQNGY